MIAAIAILAAVSSTVAPLADGTRSTRGRTSRDAWWAETAAVADPPQPPITPGPWTYGLQSTGHKTSSSDQYHTLSSLLASAPDGGGAVTEAAQRDEQQLHPGTAVASADHVYPGMTLSAARPATARPQPPPSSYRPANGRGAHYGPDTDDAWSTTDDRQQQRPAEYSTGDPMPSRWSTTNNKYVTGQRQLKKYGPLIMETEVTTTDGGDATGYGGGGATGNSGSTTGYSGGGYDNEADYSSSMTAYDVDSYYKPPVSSSNGGGSGGLSAAGWFGEIFSPRPAANVVQPAAVAVTKKSSFDVQKMSTLALVLIGLAKLKLLTAIKFLALLAVKLKALALLKLMAFAKFAAFGKLFNLLVLPFLPNWLTWLRNITMFPMNQAMGMNMASAAASEAASANNNNNVQQLRNDSAPVEKSAVAESRAGFDPDDGASSLAAAASLLQYVASAKSDKCVERLTCHVAGTRPLNFRSVLVDWILSSMVNYIPNKKLKSYMTTYKDFSDYRLENIFKQPSADEWLKWCDERYYCEEDAINNNFV